jgi:hypothetical protein
MSNLHVRKTAQSQRTLLGLAKVTRKKQMILKNYIMIPDFSNTLYIQTRTTNANICLTQCGVCFITTGLVLIQQQAQQNFLKENNESQPIDNIFSFVSMATSTVLFFPVWFHRRIRFAIKITDTLRNIPYNK